MNDFEYDVMQKKRLAYQAKARKCGSKSKKCSLSTDHMTQKQWKERCGEVVTYKLSGPMLWAEFKNMPVDLQEQYLKGLIETYHVSATNLAEMFGTCAETIRNAVKTHGFEIKFTKGNKMSAEQVVAWKAFVEASPEQNDVIESPKPEGHAKADAQPVASSEGDGCSKSAEMSLKQFSLRFAGKIDANMIANSILRVAGKDAFGEIDIYFQME